MEIYVLVSFILNLVAVVGLLKKLGTYNYTIPGLQSVGQDVFTMFVTSGFVIWSGILLF